MFDYTILQKADVSAAELAWLLNQHRSTVYKWVYGKGEPSSNSAHALGIMLDKITDAVDNGALPLEIGTPRAIRKSMLRSAVDGIA